VDCIWPSAGVSNACESGKMQELGLPSPGLPTGGSTEKGHEMAR